MNETITIEAQNKRIAELENELRSAKAYQVHELHFASYALDKLSTDLMCGSGVIISITSLSGKPLVEPTVISDGLSLETIAALQADMRRSFEKRTELKPKGMTKND